jgi:hypothetical protein
LSERSVRALVAVWTLNEQLKALVGFPSCETGVTGHVEV